jgi:disulfide bond formation protein DsbB
MRRLLILFIVALVGWSSEAAFAERVSADFNGDGFSDLAVGVASEDIGVLENAGAVNVLYGSERGVSAAGNQFWHQDSPGIEDTAEMFDQFGSALAAGDFDGDGFADLAIGVQGEEVLTAGSRAGAVAVLYGSATGLTASGSQFWHQDSPGVLDFAEQSDRFGSRLVAANFGKGAHSDLAIGVEGESIALSQGAGAVSVLYGSSTGLSASGNQFWHQDSPEIQNVAEENDAFGFGLAAGNFGKSPEADLAVGVFFEVLHRNVGGLHGAVNVLYGSDAGLTAAGDQFWHQDKPGVEDLVEDNDNFGFPLAAANFGRSGHADLAIGVNSENIGGVDGAGAVAVLYGSPSGLSATGDQFWHQDSVGVLDSVEQFDFFGNALTGADFGKSTEADLAIGTRFEDVGSTDDAGAVNVLYGSPGGLTAAEDQFLHQDTAGIEDFAEQSDFFGTALAAANFGKSSRADIAIGVNGEANFAGAVALLYGSSTGLSSNGDQLWNQDSAGIEDTAEPVDFFGGRLAP